MNPLLDIRAFKKAAKRRYILNIVLYVITTVLVLTGVVLLLLLSNLDYMFNLIANILITCLFVLGSIFYFLNIFPIIHHYYAFYRDMNEVALEHRNNMVYIEEQEQKIINNVKYRNLQFCYHEKQEIYYENIYVLDNDVTFNANHRYRLKTYHNVIIRYEESTYADN